MTKPISLIPLLGLTFAGLWGCSGQVTKDDCKEANYYQMGLEDGQEGRSAERLQKYKEVCGAANVAEERYEYGRSVGLVQYCDSEKGEADAEEGVRSPVCLQAEVPPYETAYSEELAERRDEIMEELNELQKSKEELQQRQDKLQSQLDQINQRQQTVQQ